MSNEMYDAACRYQEIGCAVIPVRRDNNKPAIRWGQVERDGGLSAAELRRHFVDDQHNVGIICGSASRGLMMLDIDDTRSYLDFEDRHRRLAFSLPFEYSHEGMHFAFYACEGERQTRRYTVRGSKWPRPVHIKGDKSVVTVAPSYRRHPEKPDQWIHYQWVRPLPDNLSNLPVIHPTELLPNPTLPTKQGIASYQHDTSGGVTTATWMAAHAAAVRYQPVGPGTRSGALFAMARCLRGQFGGAVTADELANVFAAWHLRIQSKSYVQDKDYRSNWGQFCYAWDHIRHDNRQALAVLVADYSLTPDASAEERVWQVCLSMAKWDDRGVFYLAGSTAALIADCNQTYASRCLKKFERAGRLQILEPHSFPRREAKTYQLVQGGQNV
ncbi:MAG: bifunctional DNA primase/polymerase [Planctomycetia bacterium]|nr:bifunctional DNA primase/polymerase [Planctomycetia bacterium]